MKNVNKQYSLIDAEKVFLICTYCTVGWVNFSECKIIVCGSCKMSKRT